MSKLYRVISKDYVTKILSEQIISIDYVDIESIQNIVEFVEFANPTIQYKADDFLFSLSKENEGLLGKNKWLELSKVEQFGWYYAKIHKSEIQLYESTNPKKYNGLTNSNNELKIASFDKYRDFYRPIKATNVLNGAFGLAYTVFKDDYDNFFRKIKIQKDKWIFDKSDLNKSDYPILTHLFLFYNAETKGLYKTLLKDNELEGVRIFSYYLETALNYFLRNDYTMDNFLSEMQEEFAQYPKLKVFADDFKLLNDRYVKKGLSIETKNPITIATKEFIDLAKTESENLNELLTQNDLNKTAVFLLGMLNLGDRIDEQFSFDNFIPAIVDLTMRHIVDIKVSEKEVVISFDQKEIEKNRNNKFDYVKNYFKELHTLKDFSDELNDLTQKSSLFKKIYASKTEIIELDAESKELVKEIEQYDLQKEDLIDQVRDSRWFDKKYEEWINSENEKESLKEITKSLSGDISRLKEDKKDYEKNKSDLSSDNESLKGKIKTLKHTKKALNLEKEQLEKKDESSKKSKTKNSEKSSESKKKVVQKPKGKSKKIEDGQTSLLPEDKSPTPTPPDG
jgi:hypothetical protein